MRRHRVAVSACASWVGFVADQSSGQGRAIAGCIRLAILRCVQLVEAQSNSASGSIHQHQLAYRRQFKRRYLNSPGQNGWAAPILMPGLRDQVLLSCHFLLT